MKLVDAPLNTLVDRLTQSAHEAIEARAFAAEFALGLSSDFHDAYMMARICGYRDYVRGFYQPPVSIAKHSGLLKAWSIGQDDAAEVFLIKSVAADKSYLQRIQAPEQLDLFEMCGLSAETAIPGDFVQVEEPTIAGPLVWPTLHS